MLLVIGPLVKGVPSSPPYWKGFDRKSIGSSSSSCSKSPTKGVRSQTLKVVLTSYSHGNSNLYALLLILWSTLKGPSPRELSLDFLCFGNLSLLKWSGTQSPSLKIISLLFGVSLGLMLYLRLHLLMHFLHKFRPRYPFLMNKITRIWGRYEV